VVAARPGLLVALVAGSRAGCFSRLIVASARGLPDRFSRWRAQHPLRFAAGCALAVAVIGIVTGGATAGAGYAPTRHAGGAANTGRLHPAEVLRHLAVGVDGRAGGVFAPSLAIGAGIGHDVALLTGVGRRGGDPAHRAGHGRLPGGHDAGPDHGLHHRDGDGRRPGRWC
jgi:H+/Cl- antiporter ClcA